MEHHPPTTPIVASPPQVVPPGLPEVKYVRDERIEVCVGGQWERGWVYRTTQKDGRLRVVRQAGSAIVTPERTRPATGLWGIDQIENHSPPPGASAPAASVQDNHELDGTDAAHPAWWRGHHHTVASLCQIINNILDGKPSSGVAGEPWESTRKRIVSLAPAAAVSGELLAAAKDALRELSFCVEGAGRKGGLYEKARDRLKEALSRATQAPAPEAGREAEMVDDDDSISWPLPEMVRVGTIVPDGELKAMREAMALVRRIANWQTDVWCEEANIPIIEKAIMEARRIMEAVTNLSGGSDTTTTAAAAGMKGGLI